MVVDGIDAAQIRILLESFIVTQEHEEMLASEMFEAMGGYAPTVGILGAVMGLITVMSHLEDPTKLGSGIATAFVATVYGVGAANLICLPIGNKLKVLVRRRMRRLEMITEAMVGIAIMEQPMQFEHAWRRCPHPPPHCTPCPNCPPLSCCFWISKLGRTKSCASSKRWRAGSRACLPNVQLSANRPAGAARLSDRWSTGLRRSCRWQPR